MLYKRILTAIPFAAFVFWIIFFQPTSVFFFFVLFIASICAYEWAKLSGVKNNIVRLLYAVAITAIPWSLNHYAASFAADYVMWLIYVAVLWWFSIAYFLKFAKPKPPDAKLKIDKLFIAIIVLPATALAMQKIHALHIVANLAIDWAGPKWLFYALSLIWIADIGAYSFGKKFGKNKLAPYISPGKTKEGLIGAVIVASLYALLASYYFELDTERAMLLILLSIIVTFISVSGDLYISFLKREAGLKDSGRILPGHGGMLDRLDSILAAMPVFIVGFNLLILPDVM